MSQEERLERLSALSEHYHLKDSDVIEMAANGTLPPDPEFAEWLIFLGRGDLAR